MYKFNKTNLNGVLTQFGFVFIKYFVTYSSTFSKIPEAKRIFEKESNETFAN